MRFVSSTDLIRSNSDTIVFPAEARKQTKGFRNENNFNEKKNKPGAEKIKFRFPIDQWK